MIRSTVAQQAIVAMELTIATWLTADKFGIIRFLVDKLVSAYVLSVPGGILATSVVAFVLAGLGLIMDVKVMPDG